MWNGPPGALAGRKDWPTVLAGSLRVRSMTWRNEALTALPLVKRPILGSVGLSVSVNCMNCTGSPRHQFAVAWVHDPTVAGSGVVIRVAQ